MPKTKKWYKKMIEKCDIKYANDDVRIKKIDIKEHIKWKESVLGKKL